MMNKALNAVLNNFHANPSQLKVSLFHSTPILERKRRTHWDCRFNQSSRRGRKQHGHQQMLRNMGALAEQLFQRWKYEGGSYDSSTNNRSSWFRQNFKGNGSKGGRSMNSGPHGYYRSGFQFFEDYDDIDDVETVFNSAFGGSRNHNYSFIDDEPKWESSEGYSNNNYRSHSNPRFRYHEDYCSNKRDNPKLNVRSDRLALGLKPSGPLNLEDVKNAYRGCALKWHPDRHQGSSKAMAEEKFKVCSAAYQSICDKLSLN